MYVNHFIWLMITCNHNFIVVRPPITIVISIAYFRVGTPGNHDIYLWLALLQQFLLKGTLLPVLLPILIHTFIFQTLFPTALISHEFPFPCKGTNYNKIVYIAENHLKKQLIYRICFSTECNTKRYQEVLQLSDWQR